MVENQSPNSEEAILDAIVTTPYKYGFKTNLETEKFEKGLNEEIVKKISLKKDEPEFLRKFRNFAQHGPVPAENRSVDDNKKKKRSPNFPISDFL